MSDPIITRLQAALAGRYAPARLVGEGGMALVYQAEDLKHHRFVAIKVLKPELTESLGAARFLREIAVAARLQHPQIVPLYDSGEADGLLYYVMPYLEGESLRGLLEREGPQPLLRVVELVRDVAAGLDAAHAAGVVHRDVKPENIMLTGERAVLADFGIAQAVAASQTRDGRLTGTGMALGTPAYMSPEQLMGESVDARADQYALAAIAWELLSGRRPVLGESLVSRPSVAGLSAGVTAVLQRALSLAPESRYPDLRQFSRALAEASEGRAKNRVITGKFGVLGVGVVAVAALLGGLFLRRPTGMVVPGAETMAIVPFTVRGPGLDGMGEGVVDLLESRLDGMDAIQVVSSRRIIREWNQIHGVADLADALTLAGKVNAGSVLMGSMVSTAGRVEINADLYDREGKRLGHVQANGDTLTLHAAIASLAGELIREVWRSSQPLPSLRVANIAENTPLTAIRAYLRGMQFHRRGQWDSAMAAFQVATREDSTFALAWYRIAITGAWMETPEAKNAATNAIAKALSFSESLNLRLHALVVATNLYLLQGEGMVDSAQAYTNTYPDDLEGWYILGETQAHTQGENNLPSQTAILNSFERALEIDSTFVMAIPHAGELALQIRDTARLRRYETILRANGDSAWATELHNAGNFMLGEDGPDVKRWLRSETDSLDGFFMRAALIGRVNQDGVDSIVINRTITLLQQNYPANPGPTRMSRLAMVTFLREGIDPLGGVMNPAEMSELTLRSSQPGVLTLFRDVFPYLKFGSDHRLQARADSIAAGLRGRLDSVPGEPMANLNAYPLILRVMLTYDLGEYARTRELAAEVARRYPGSIEYKVATVLDGLARVQGARDLEGLRLADSILNTVQGGDRIWMVMLEAELRFNQVALTVPAWREAAIQRLKRYRTHYDLRTIAPRYYLLAQGYEQANQRDSAAVYYRRFLGLYAAPDSNRLVRDARAGLQRSATDRGAELPIGRKR